MPSGIFYLKSLDRSFPVEWGLFSYIIIMFYGKYPIFNANRVDPDQTLHSAASDLGLYCLPMSLLWDAKLNCIAKRRIYNFDPLKPTPFLYSKTGVYTGIHYFC